MGGIKLKRATDFEIIEDKSIVNKVGQHCQGDKVLQSDVRQIDSDREAPVLFLFKFLSRSICIMHKSRRWFPF